MFPYTFPMLDEETGNNVPSTDRTRKHKKKQAKRRSAAGKGVTLLEGVMVAMKGREFTVYVWDESTGDFEGKYSGVLDKPYPGE